MKKYLFFLGFSILLDSTTAFAIDVFAYIPNINDDNVSVINTATDTVVATVSVGNEPYGIAISPDGTKVYITNFNAAGAGTVSVINAATNTVTDTISVGDGPRGAVVNPAGTTLYVANAGATTISVINTATNTVTGTISLSSNPWGVTINPLGTKLYATLSNAGQLAVVNTATSAETDISLASLAAPNGVAILPDGSKVYAGGGGAFFSDAYAAVVDTSSETLLTNILVASGITSLFGVSASPDGNKVYTTRPSADELVVINPSTDTVTNSVTVGDAPYGVSVTPDSSKIYVVNSTDGTVSVVNATTELVTATITVGSNPRALGSFITPLPGVTLSPSTLTFSSQTVGTSSSAQSITFLNSGNGILSITSIAASGDFSQTNTCSATLPAGNSCTISVIFTPTAAGSRSGSITVTSNATSSPNTVSLSGTGASSGGNTVTIDVPTGTSIQASNAIQEISLVGSTNLTNPSYLWEIVSTSTGDLSNAGSILNSTSSTAIYFVPANALTQTVTLQLTVVGTSDSLSSPLSAATSTLTTTTQLNITGNQVVGGGCTFIATQKGSATKATLFFIWSGFILFLTYFRTRKVQSKKNW